MTTRNKERWKVLIHDLEKKTWLFCLVFNVFAHELGWLKGWVQESGKSAIFYIIDEQNTAPLDRMNMPLSFLQQTNLTMASYHVQ